MRSSRPCLITSIALGAPLREPEPPIFHCPPNQEVPLGFPVVVLGVAPPSAAGRPVHQGEAHVPEAEHDGEIEVVNPPGSGRDEDINEERHGVQAVEEDIEELLVGPRHEIVLHHDGVEEGPVDQSDEHRHGARHVLQGPGDSKRFLESYQICK